MAVRMWLRKLQWVWASRSRPTRRMPAVDIEKSVTRNALICLDTGTRHVCLRRHLSQTLGLSPAEYRRRWGLPDDYPMVAQSYITRRKKRVSSGMPVVE